MTVHTFMAGRKVDVRLPSLAAENMDEVKMIEYCLEIGAARVRDGWEKVIDRLLKRFSDEKARYVRDLYADQPSFKEMTAWVVDGLDVAPAGTIGEVIYGDERGSGVKK